MRSRTMALFWIRIAQKLLDFCMALLNTGPKSPEDRRLYRIAIYKWRKLERERIALERAP